MASDMHWEFATNVSDKLRDEVNGLVKYEIYGNIDTVIFKIFFKEFDFKYGVSEVSSIIYDGKTDEIVEDILRCYKKSILNGFFKTENRKKRDKELRLGIPREEYV